MKITNRSHGDKVLSCNTTIIVPVLKRTFICWASEGVGFVRSLATAREKIVKKKK